MKVLVTGGSGFVGSNLVHVFAEHGAEVLAPSHAELDLTDRDLVAGRVADLRPDAIVHAAIWNDPAGLTADRRRAWDGYVGATRNVVDAANGAGAQVVLVSTDWVFDGSQGPAREIDPPNPINTYGFLKAASELAVTLRAKRGIVARIAAVQGVHRARPSSPGRVSVDLYPEQIGVGLERTVRLASAAGSYVAGRLAFADAMPTLADLEVGEEVRA
jgi:dTDP-4-dehydrorhamnose reductase